jgi:hypothetical protein
MGCPPASPGTRLTSPRHPADQKGETQGDCGTPPTRRDNRAASHDQPLKTATRHGSRHQPKIKKDRG